MNSLFDDAGLASALERIRRLTADTPAAWGKMTVGQMLAHVQTPLLIATGEVKLKRSLLGRVLGGLVKKSVVGPKPFKQGLPTDPRFVVKDERDFAKEQGVLITCVEIFGRGGAAGVTPDPHPFFGKLSPAQWDGLMWKHLDHHLRQFGA